MQVGTDASGVVPCNSPGQGGHKDRSSLTAKHCTRFMIFVYYCSQLSFWSTGCFHAHYI